MNFRITTFFFALLLTMLWGFGLMIAHKKAGGDQSAIMPSLGESGVKIDKVVVKRAKGKDTEPFEANLVSEGDQWLLKDPKSGQTARVEGWRVNGFVKLIQAAKNEESADVNKGPSNYGLDKPRIEVTLEGVAKPDGERKQWTFAVGEDRGGFAYVMGSDHAEKVFAVQRKSLEPLFFKDPNSLRSKRLFDFGETGVTKIEAKRGADELELRRDDPTHWTFLKPKYGPAGVESDAEEKPKKKDRFGQDTPAPPAASGIKGLLNNISAIQVDDEEDFEPLGSSMNKFGLEPGKESMRIEVTSAKEKGEPKEILYIGDKVTIRKIDYYYARMENDQGVVKIRWSRLEPVAKAIEDPGKLRSLDIAVFERKDVDAVVLKEGKEELKFFKFKSETEEPKFHMPPQPSTAESWKMIVGTDEKKASDTMIQTLLEQVLGKKGIVQFHDGKEEELKKKEAGWGLDKPTAEIVIYLGGLEKDKKDAKKDEAKKDEAKKDSLPTLKSDAKAEVTLAIGKIDGDVVNVRRTLKDGAVTWFTIKKDFVEKVLPPQVELAYLDPSLPTFGLGDVVSFQLFRVTDKGPETLEVSRRFVEEAPVWFIKDPLDPNGYRPAEARAVGMLLGELSQLQAKKWLKKLDKSEDLDKYGLKNPTVKITLAVTTPPRTLATIIGLMCIPDSLLTAAVGVAMHSEAGEPVTIEFGKETDDAKDKPGAFARHSGSPLLFLAASKTVDFLKKADLRDRTSMLYGQVQMEAMSRTSAAINPINALMFASPYFTGNVQQIDPQKVTKVRLSVRTPYELRAFEFDRKEKDKAKEPEKAKDDKTTEKDKEKAKEAEKDKELKWTWTDKSGLQEFQLDPDKVTQLVKDFSKLRADRFVAFAGGPRSEHKLDPKEATVKLDLTTEDGKTITVLIGANFQQNDYFAQTSAWPEVVFLIPQGTVAPLLNGASHFAKPRSNAE